MCFLCQMLQSRFLSSILNGPEINATYGLPQHQQHQQQQGPMLGGPCGLDFRTMGSAVDTYLRRTTSAPITGLSGITNSMDTFGDDASQVTNLPFPLKLVIIGSLNGSFPYMRCDVMMCWHVVASEGRIINDNLESNLLAGSSLQSIGWDGELQSIVQTGFGRLGSSILDSNHCKSSPPTKTTS